MYPLKLKGISICFSMLKAALCGSYVNFGVFRSRINFDFSCWVNRNFDICDNNTMFLFRLYGDEALDNALNTFVTLLLSIPQVFSFFAWDLNLRSTLSPQTDLLDYPKLSQTYYVLLECLAQDHMAFLATLEPQVPRKCHET